MHNGGAPANTYTHINIVYLLVIVNKYEFSSLLSFFPASASPFLLPCLTPFYPPSSLALSSLLGPLLAASRSPFPDLAVSMHPSLDCFLSTCEHALHSPVFLPICSRSSLVFILPSLTLSLFCSLSLPFLLQVSSLTLMQPLSSSKSSIM